MSIISNGWQLALESEIWVYILHSSNTHTYKLCDWGVKQNIQKVAQNALSISKQ